MPQFRPFRWINYVSWTLVLLAGLTSYLHLIFLPKFLILQRIRLFLTLGN